MHTEAHQKKPFANIDLWDWWAQRVFVGVRRASIPLLANLFHSDPDHQDPHITGMAL